MCAKTCICLTGEGEKRRKRRVEREKSKSKQEGNRPTDRDSQTDRQTDKREVVVLEAHHISLFACPLSFVRISAAKILATSPRPCSLVLFREHFSYSFWIEFLGISQACFSF